MASRPRRHLGFLLVVAVSFSTLSGAQELERVSRQAAQAREAGKLEEAIRLYRRAVELEPSWLEGWWYLGTLQYDLDRYPEARDAFRRFVALDEEAAPAWALLGLCEFQTREYDRALASLNRAQALGLTGNDQLVYVARYHLALLLTRFEQFEASHSLLLGLAREHFDNPQIVEALGLAVLRQPFLPIELPPDRREMVLLAGRAAAASASLRPEEAEREYRQLVERYPETPHVHYAYGVFLLQGNPEEALRQFRRELEISPAHLPAHLQIAFEYLKQRKPEEGLPYARKAVELDPRSFVARNALGRLYLEAGRIEEAISELETGVKLAPDSPQMHFALAQAYARAGRRQEAEQARAEFLRLNQLVRSQREGPQAVGGIPVEPQPTPPPSEP